MTHKENLTRYRPVRSRIQARHQLRELFVPDRTMQDLMRHAYDLDTSTTLSQVHKWLIVGGELKLSTHIEARLSPLAEPRG